MRPIVRNIQNNQFYFFNGGNEFENLISGQKGTVDDETAAKVFKFCMELTELVHEFPEIANLIKSFGLKFEKYERLS